MLTWTTRTESKTLLDQLCQAFPIDSQQMTLMLISILSIAVSVPSIALRWWARCKSSQLGWDDYMALVAAFLLVVLAGLQLESKYIYHLRSLFIFNTNYSL